MGLEFEVPEGLRGLFAGHIEPELKVEIVSNVIYMAALAGYTLAGAERAGHSDQAPEGWLRPNIPAIETYFYHEMGDVLEAIVDGGNPNDEMKKGLTNVGNYALYLLAPDVPVDTGLARNSLRLIGVDGSVKMGPQQALAPSKWKDKAFVKEYRKAKKLRKQ